MRDVTSSPQQAVRVSVTSAVSPAPNFAVKSSDATNTLKSNAQNSQEHKSNRRESLTVPVLHSKGSSVGTSAASSTITITPESVSEKSSQSTQNGPVKVSAPYTACGYNDSNSNPPAIINVNFGTPTSSTRSSVIQSSSGSSSVSNDTGLMVPTARAEKRPSISLLMPFFNRDRSNSFSNATSSVEPAATSASTSPYQSGNSNPMSDNTDSKKGNGKKLFKGVFSASKASPSNNNNSSNTASSKNPSSKSDENSDSTKINDMGENEAMINAITLAVANHNAATAIPKSGSGSRRQTINYNDADSLKGESILDENEPPVGYKFDEQSNYDGVSVINSGYGDASSNGDSFSNAEDDSSMISRPYRIGSTGASAFGESISNAAVNTSSNGNSNTHPKIKTLWPHMQPSNKQADNCAGSGLLGNSNNTSLVAFCSRSASSSRSPSMSALSGFHTNSEENHVELSLICMQDTIAKVMAAQDRLREELEQERGCRRRLEWEIEELRKLVVTGRTNNFATSTATVIVTAPSEKDGASKDVVLNSDDEMQNNNIIITEASNNSLAK